MPEFIKQLHRVGFGWIFPKMSGKGIATAFIDYLKKIVKKTSVAISLEVGVGNKKAKKLYQRLGFKSEGYQFMLKTL